MIEFTVKLERDPANIGTLVIVETFILDQSVIEQGDRRTLLGLLQTAITDAIKK